MIASFRAEWSRLTRRRALLAGVALVLVVAAGSAVLVLSAAEPARVASPDALTPTLESLASAGGGTEVFRVAAALAGTLTFIVFVGLFALEYARGTYRTMLLHQPRRIALLAGKLLGLLAFAAVVLAALEIATWAVAWIVAPAFGVDTARWTSVDALGSAVGDYGSAMLWVTGYAVFGMAVAILVRSVAPALAIAIAWAGPFDHLLARAWSPARGYFPGLLLEVLGAGGVAGVSVTRAALASCGYIALFALVAAVVFRRRDVTA
jgi:ABC-2 type transport system permease protein